MKTYIPYKTYKAFSLFAKLVVPNVLMGVMASGCANDYANPFHTFEGDNTHQEVPETPSDHIPVWAGLENPKTQTAKLQPNTQPNTQSNNSPNNKPNGQQISSVQISPIDLVQSNNYRYIPVEIKQSSESSEETEKTVETEETDVNDDQTIQTSFDRPFIPEISTKKPVDEDKAQKIITKGKLVKTPAKTEEYRVRKGDTLYSIAKRYCVNVDEVARLNVLNESNTINIDQVLIIPKKQCP